MEWLDDLAGAFPAKRDDEPPDLRRQIIAELQDHLQAAMHREVLLTGDPGQARKNVLTRFGDPARLARKLWFEAMWEKLMTQRLMLVALVVVVFVSFGSMGLTWFLVVQAGQMNRALIEQNRATNELLLAKLTTLGNGASRPEKSMDWNSLKVRLSTEKSGAPAAGLQVTLQGHLLDQTSVMALVRTTGADGVADFGLVRTGQHQVAVVTPWGESINHKPYDAQIVTMMPGEPQTLEIVCPTKPEETEILIAVDWPQELAGRPLWLVCDFIPLEREVAGESWRRQDDSPQYIVVDPSGKLTNPDLRRSVSGPAGNSSSIFLTNVDSFWSTKDEESRDFVNSGSVRQSHANSPGLFRYQDSDPQAHLWLPKATAVARLKWLAGTYSVAHIFIGCNMEAGEPSLPDNLLHPVFLGGITLRAEEEGPASLLYPDEHHAHVQPIPMLNVKTKVPKFEAVAGRLNEWRVSLPEPLVKLVTEPAADALPDSEKRDNSVISR